MGNAPGSTRADTFGELDDAAFTGCTVRTAQAALAMLDGRWKLRILFHLAQTPVMRYSELARAIPAVSQKVLTQQLKEMERDGLMRRTVHPEVPPRVEYTLTPRGVALREPLMALVAWMHDA